MQEREARPGDVNELEELEARFFSANCFGAELLKSELAHGAGWVVEGNGSIVAYLLARADADLVDITRVAVLPEYRGRGYGTRLIARAAIGYRRAMLTVQKSNAPALRLYMRLGFEIAGAVDDSWVMLLHRA